MAAAGLGEAPSAAVLSLNRHRSCWNASLPRTLAPGLAVFHRRDNRSGPRLRRPPSSLHRAKPSVVDDARPFSYTRVWRGAVVSWPRKEPYPPLHNDCDSGRRHPVPNATGRGEDTPPEVAGRPALASDMTQYERAGRLSAAKLLTRFRATERGLHGVGSPGARFVVLVEQSTGLIPSMQARVFQTQVPATMHMPCGTDTVSFLNSAPHPAAVLQGYE